MSSPEAGVAKGGYTDGMHVLVSALRMQGVENIYGVVGIPVTDFARIAQSEGLRYIGFRHESDAGNAAAIAGYLTKSPGVCLTVSAPGFLNGLVALAAATTNCFPMVQISGSSERHIVDLQRGDYEELDQFAVAKTFAKASYRVDRAQDIGLAVARAFRTAASGRPGGVYLDVPADTLADTIALAEVESTIWPLVEPAPSTRPSDEAVDRALELLAGARKPLIVLGKGAAYAQADDKINRFIEQTGLPFLPMSMAKGLVPDGHPQSVATTRSFALKEADVVLLVGARLNWLLSHGEAPHWNPNARFIQIDVDPREFDSNRPTSAPLAGDIGAVMDVLLQRSANIPVTAPAPWREALSDSSQAHIAEFAERLAADPVPMGYHNALRAIRDVLADRPEVYLVNEGANTLDVARNVIDMKVPRHRLDTGTWGVMGVGMGYAIGTAVETGQPVVAVEGDSAFGFSGMELETICRYVLPVVVVIFNNGGIYRGDGHNLAGSDPSPTTLMQTARHEKLIEAFGGVGYHVETSQELATALTEALESRRPALIDAIIDPAVGTESGHLTNFNPRHLNP